MVYIHSMRLLLLLCLITPLATFAEGAPAAGDPATTPASSIPASTADSEPRYLPLLDKSVLDSEVVTLGQGEQAFRGLYRQDRSGKPKGALLILHRYQGEPGWADLRSTLQNTLSERGWGSLAVALSGSENKTAIQERLRLGQEYLIQKGQMNIALLCYRWDCVAAAGHVAAIVEGSSQLQPLQAWVLLDAQNGPTGNEPLFLKDIKKTGLQVLDITTDPRFREQQDLRETHVKQQKWPHWQFARLPETPPASASAPARIVSRISGWLDKTIEGKVLDASIRRDGG